MKSGETAAPVMQVGDLRIDRATETVTRGRERIELPDLSWRLLLRLADAAPEPVAVELLIADVWDGVVVGADTVKQRVRLLREALGDAAPPYRYVRAVRHRGYRLVSAESIDRDGRRAWPIVLSAGALVAGLWAASVAWRGSSERAGPVRLAVVPGPAVPGEAAVERWRTQLIDDLAGVDSLEVLAASTPVDDATRSGLDALVEVSVEGAGESQHLILRLVDPVSGVQVLHRDYPLPDGEDPERSLRQSQHAAGILHQMLSATLGHQPRSGGSAQPAARAEYRLGMRHFAQSGAGNRQAAEAAFGRALEADPGFALARARLADLFADRGLRGESGWAERALEEADQALEGAPRLAEARFARAKALLALGRNAEAFQLLDEVVAERPYLQRSVDGLRRRAD